jgi:hypothetical protein
MSMVSHCGQAEGQQFNMWVGMEQHQGQALCGSVTAYALMIKGDELLLNQVLGWGW